MTETYDPVEQPGLAETKELIRRTWRPGVYEVPGLGYTVEAMENPGLPDQLPER